MQTLQFTRGLTRIFAELKAQELLTFLQPYVRRGSSVGVDDAQRDRFSALVIASQVGYSRLREEPRLAKILNAFGIEELYSAQRFGRLIRGLGALQQSSQTFGNPDLFVEFYSMYDSLTWLQKVVNCSSQLLEAEKIPPSLPENEIFEVRLLDYDGSGIDNERVQQFFASFAELHAILSQFLNVSGSSLKVAYIDSGSDMLVAFQSARVLVDIVKGLLAEYWEKVKFQPFESFERKIDALSKGLTFVGQVKTHVDNNAISEADARVLTHRVLAEMTTLVGIGASLPEDEVVETVDNRKLLTAKRGIKLLGAGNDQPASNP